MSIVIPKGGGGAGGIQCVIKDFVSLFPEKFR